MKLKWFKIYFIAYAIIITFIVGCGPIANQIVMLSRDNYVSKINPDDYKVFQGKRILFHSIIDKSTNTSNLAYYNPERTVGYGLYYKSPGDGWAQPVVSFFWYALKKGFDHAGIIMEESSPIYDAELTITFRSVTDREINFDVIFTKTGKLYYQKNYSVKSPDVQTINNAVLEERAYGMLDSMVKAILDDPDFKNMFFKTVVTISKI
jgi:hypothetical protein